MRVYHWQPCYLLGASPFSLSFHVYSYIYVTVLISRCGMATIMSVGIGNGYVNILVVGVPIGMVISVNIFLFSFTVHGIRETNKNTKMVRKDKSTKQQAKEELIISIKVSPQDLLKGDATSFCNVGIQIKQILACTQKLPDSGIPMKTIGAY